MTTPAAPPTAPRPVYVAHLHLLAVVATESARFSPGQVVRVLDAGCGVGDLIAHLAETLPRTNPTLTYELHGFDVDDFLAHTAEATVRYLTERCPGTEWTERIAFIPSTAAWPYADGSFDVIISNQVGEHLNDHGCFVGEIARCLDAGGFSINLFPLKHVIMEWHVLVPFAHKVKNYDALKAFILTYRRFKAAVLRRGDPQIYELAVMGAEYVVKYTGYVGYGELLSIAKRHGLLVSMRYTREFYVQKLRQMRSRPPPPRLPDDALRRRRLVARLRAPLPAKRHRPPREAGPLPTPAAMSPCPAAAGRSR